jgi:hypothetical protein
MRQKTGVARVQAISTHAFLRIEWTPEWSVQIRQVAIRLALLAGLLWGGAAEHLDTILKQL